MKGRGSLSLFYTFFKFYKLLKNAEIAKTTKLRCGTDKWCFKLNNNYLWKAKSAACQIWVALGSPSHFGIINFQLIVNKCMKKMTTRANNQIIMSEKYFTVEQIWDWTLNTKLYQQRTSHIISVSYCYITCDSLH